MELVDLDRILKLTNLKEEQRTGWQIQNVDRPETVAAHSWGASLLTLLVDTKRSIDRQKAVRMAILHDIEQSLTGDIPTRPDTDRDVFDRELDAAEALLDGQDEMLETWKEKQRMETFEAKFVEDMEQLDMVIQALRYEKDQRYGEDGSMDEFFRTADQNIQTDPGKELFKKVRREYESCKEE
jgi:putative hydrolase of HD superfamily